MESVLVLVACAVIAIPVMSIWALVRASTLRAEMARLEHERVTDRELVSNLQKRMAKLEAAMRTTVDASAADLPEGPKAAPPVAPPQPTVQPPIVDPAPDVIPTVDAPVADAGDGPRGPESIAARIEGADPAQDHKTVWPTATGGRSAAAERRAQKTDPAEPSGPSYVDKAMEWLKENWFLAAAAASLALSGLFLIQYSAQHGLLSPAARIWAALGLGLALIGGGEIIRRRMGAGDEDATGGASDYLPSTFAGAGLFTLFGAFVAARHMYHLIGAEQAFAGLIATALLAVLLGWFYGPLLACVGILAAAIVPFIVGGGTGPEPVLFAYYAVLAIAALGVDALRRWVWVSGLGVGGSILASFALWFAWSQTNGSPVDTPLHLWLLGTLAVITLAAAVAPKHSFTPVYEGAVLHDPQARVFIGSAFALGFATVWVAAVSSQMTVFWTALAVQAAMALGVVIWLKRSAPLAWMLGVPMAAFTMVVLAWSDRYALVQGLSGPAGDNMAQIDAGRAVPQWIGQLPGVLPALLLGVAVFYSAAAFVMMRRSGTQGGGFAIPKVPGSEPELAIAARLNRRVAQMFAAMNGALIWALVAACFAPVVAGVLELIWAPADVMGRGPWAAAVMGVAAAMVILTERSLHGAPEGEAAHDPSGAIASPAHQRAALFAIAALTMISLSLTIVLSDMALSVSLAVMVVLAALADRKMNLPALAVFAQAGTIIIGARLTSEALGLGIFITSPQVGLGELLLWSGVTMALLFAAWKMLQARARSAARITIESALFVLGAVLASETVARIWGDILPDHAQAGLNAALFFVLLGAQLWRMQIGGEIIQWVRRGLAALFALGGGFALFAASVVLNPLWLPQERVLGPFLLDTAAIGLALPAVILAFLARLLPRALKEAPQDAKLALYGVAGWCGAAYGWIELRRLWHGRDVALGFGVMQSEMYVYTVLMLIAAAALFYIAFARRSVLLRKVATGLVAVTIAKVFFLDVGGLDGLWRVASFLGLGLALGGLAWLTRLMSAQWERVAPADAIAGDDGGGDHSDGPQDPPERPET